MPNPQHCFNCTTIMKPCKCKGLISLLKCQPFSKFFKYLRRHTNRRRSTRRFRSVHAIFWPLMSLRSDDRERPVENPSLTLTETETETETVLRPLPIEPIPLTSSFTKIESTPPDSSSHTKVEPTPLSISSIENVEPSHPPIASSYTKAKPSHSPVASSSTKDEPSSTAVISTYVKRATKGKDVEERTTKEDFEVQKACQSFEKYIMEMILEERKVRDLLDVEELMYCMDKLTSPAFIELVCTFYGELCLDVFSNESDESGLKFDGNF